MSCAVAACAQADAPGFIQRQTEAFRNSEIEFKRARSNVPFPPIAFLGASAYGDAEVEGDERGIDLEYNLTSVSQGAVLPFLVTDQDALLVGEYLSYSEFDVSGSDIDDFDVTTVGLPLAWFRQARPGLQVAAFVMPMGHDNSLDNGGWTWQTLGGGFTRWTQREDLWWAFGFYFDLAPDENFYIPYLGASWQIDERWTLSAVMPWPALLYAPSDQWLLRLGAAPSAASWSVNPGDGNTTVNIDAWDFGIGMERRVAGNIWAGAEGGIGGLRGVRLSGDDLEDPDVDVGSSWYLTLSVKLRPGLLE